MSGAKKTGVPPSLAALIAGADAAHYADTLHCNRCGFCTSACPTYLATGDERLSPRGRNQTFRALLEGKLKDPAEAKQAFDTCLLCGICTSVCFAEVPTAKLMTAARAKGLAAGGRPLALRLVLGFLLPRPKLFEALLRIAFWGKRAGVSALLHKVGLLRLINPQLSAAEEIAETVPDHFLRDTIGRRKADGRTEIVQFLACGPNYIRPSAGEATAKLVDSAGKRSGCGANVCCGLPGLSYGDMDAARALAKRNIEELEKYPEAVVLVDDSSCAATIKDYGELFEDPAWKRRAQSLALRTQDLAEWAAGNVKAPSRPAGTVTYHDPCKARYGEKIVDEPRRLLKAAAGEGYRELPEADQCCGGGGTYSFVHPEISRAVLKRKAENIASTGAETVVTSAISCLLQVQAGLRWAGSRIKALHLSEYLANYPPQK